jgi:hypothetical protein
MDHPQWQRHCNSLSGSAMRAKENAVALSLMLVPQELQTLDATHPVTCYAVSATAVEFAI